MALGTPASVTTATGTTTAVTTGSFTVANGSTIYVAVYSTLAGATQDSLTIGSSPSLSWTSVTDQLYDTTADGGTIRLRFQLWRADSTGVSTDVTITPGAIVPGFFGVQVLSLSGAARYIANVGWDTDTAGDPAPSLTSAPDAGSTVLGFFGDTTTATATPPTNYTELNEFFTNPGGGTRTLETVYDAGSAAQSATWSTTATFSFGFLVEVKEAGVGTSTGSATVTGVGHKIIPAVGTAAGVATVTGIFASIRTGVGTAAGIATIVSGGQRIITAVGTAAGYATVQGFRWGFTRTLAPGAFTLSNGSKPAFAFTRDATPDPF